ncbi:MAG: type B 50S ribosomal protein L31 [Pirellulaceae bacterium]
MKAEIHPDYKPVVFKDKTADFAILTRSTIRTSDETIKWEDGNEYPVVYVDISSASHPFYTGKQQFVDTMGRVEKFRKKFGEKYGKGKKAKEAEAAETATSEAETSES